MKRIFISFLAGLMCVGGIFPSLTWAQSHRLSQNLVEFDSHELMEKELKEEVQGKIIDPHGFLIPHEEKEPKPFHKKWPVRLFKAAAESAFLSSGLTRFSGKNSNIPPTLGAQRER